MKPKNNKTKSCSPISSDCVIWNGPDIPCIDLCNGDSVSDVVAKLASELCVIMDTLNVESYNLSCLEVNCGPETFKDLIQLLIDRICAINGIEPTPTPGSSGCPDCIVPVAPCFHYVNPQGDVVTTMQLLDYVTAIGNRVCTIINQIDIINSTLESLTERIEILENTPAPVFTIPTIVPVCTSTSVPTPITVVLANVEAAYCALVNRTGSPNSLLTAIGYQCIGLAESLRLNGIGTMNTIPGWVQTPVTVADSITNMWLTICDMRTALNSVLLNCCSTSCSDISVIFSATIPESGIIALDFTGSIPPGYTDCVPSSTITISDGNFTQIINNVTIAQDYLNSSTYNINLSPSLATGANYTITVTLRVCNPETGSECQIVIQQFIINTEACPSLNVTPDINSVDYTATYIGGPSTLTISLYQGLTLIGSHVYNPAGNNVYNNTFSSLLPNTNYTLRPQITINGFTTNCPDIPFTTLLCQPPTLGEVTLTID